MTAAKEYDLYCDWKDREYQALIKGKSCLDCFHCELSDGYPVGYCHQDKEFRYATDKPEENGFECFC